MKLSEIRRICEVNVGECRNEALCKAVCKEPEMGTIYEPLIYTADRDIMNFDRRKTPLRNIDDFLFEYREGHSRRNGNWRFNTWPFGEPTGTIYERFLAICRDKMTLDKVLGYTVEQCGKIAEQYKNDPSADTGGIVLTDKWDPMVFQKYEKKLLQYAIHDGVWVVFLMVTDYGYTQIPFLPNSKDELKGLKRERIESDMLLEDYIRLQNGFSIEYSQNAGVWNRHEGALYEFDVSTGKRKWQKKCPEGAFHGAINGNALRHFLEKTYWIYEMPNDVIEYVHMAKDSGSFQLRIYGKEVLWDVAALSETGDRKYSELMEAITSFLESCEKTKEQGELW